MPAPDDQPSGPGADPGPRTPLARVLVVDADARSLMRVAETLERAGLSPALHRHARRALESADLPSMSAVVCALAMPRMDGLEFLAALKADRATSHLPVVVLAPPWLAGSAGLARRLGAAEVLVEPVEDAALVGAVRRAAHLEEI